MYTWVPGESFRQHLSTNPLTTTTGATNYVTSTATTGWLVAPLDAYLDSGIHLIGVRFYYYDNDAALNPTFYICKSTLDDSIGTNPTFDCLFSGTPTATQPLYTSLRVDTNIDLIRSNGSTEQRFTVWVTNKGSNVQLAGARLIWQRQISPAPATASFVDVPNDGSVFYQAVQALADSGVTLGCDATHFCPNNNVTRLQMALFLARALGLSYHP